MKALSSQRLRHIKLPSFKKNELVILLFFCFFYTNAQLVSREILKGKVITDSIAIDNIIIKNKTSNKKAKADSEGYFVIYAKPKDTLLFSSSLFQDKQLILKQSDFDVNVLEVKIEISITALDEVVVSILSGNLEKDAKKIKVTTIDPKLDKNTQDKQFYGDQYSSPKNITMPSDLSIPYGFDAVAVGKKIGKLFSKEKEKKVHFSSTKSFQNAVKDRFTYAFFTETLALQEDEIGLFLAYCDTDEKVYKLLDIDNEIYLIEYLIKKRQDYKSIQLENKK